MIYNICFVVFALCQTILATSPTLESLCDQPDSFDCGNDRCIPGRWICDGDNDCGNFNDENQDCECDDRQFACATDEVITFFVHTFYVL